MAKLYKPLLRIYLSVINSMALLPSLIAFGLFLLALFMLYFEKKPVAEEMQGPISPVLVSNAENARLVLSILGSGIISLMVFSFSMVMIILNLATSSLSPRVIPGLITVKSYQIVLGIYIGTILYVLIMVLNIEKQSESLVPELSILIGMILGVVCLGMFIYFIHSVSRSIQVDFIIENVYKRSLANLKSDIADHYKVPVNATEPASENWPVLPVPEDGYLTIVELGRLLKLCVRHDLQMHILLRSGSFSAKGRPLMRVNKDIAGKKELLEEIYSYFLFSYTELDLRHYQYGMHQLSEVAVKALSPGINDPGTAIKAIDMLSLLFLQKMQGQRHRLMADNDGKIRIIRELFSLEELLVRYLGPIRTYGSDNVWVTERLLRCLTLLLEHDTENNYRPMLETQMQIILAAAENKLESPADREYVRDLVKGVV